MNDRKHIVLVAVQQALLGEVGPRLRAIMVDYDDSSIELDAFYDGEVDEDDREAMSCVETELIAIFPETHNITVRIHRRDYPALIPKDKVWVYYRKEALL